jgi:hypothetical protein
MSQISNPGGAGGGSGTVTSVAGGVGITNTPEPIVAAGTVDLDIFTLTTETVPADGDWFPFDDVSVSTSPSGQRKVTLADLRTALGSKWTEVEVDFGTTPVFDAQFTVVDALVSAASKVAVVESGKTATGRTAGDSQWDSIAATADPGAGTMTVYAVALPGPVVGKRKLQYQVGV